MEKSSIESIMDPSTYWMCNAIEQWISAIPLKYSLDFIKIMNKPMAHIFFLYKILQNKA